LVKSAHLTGLQAPVKFGAYRFSAHLTGLQAPVKFGAYRFLLNRALNHAVSLTSG